MKYEVKGKIISKFVGLKSKMYSLHDVENVEIKKQKETIKMLLKTQEIKNILVFCLKEKNSK